MLGNTIQKIYDNIYKSYKLPTFNIFGKERQRERALFLLKRER